MGLLLHDAQKYKSTGEEGTTLSTTINQLLAAITGRAMGIHPIFSKVCAREPNLDFYQPNQSTIYAFYSHPSHPSKHKKNYMPSESESDQTRSTNKKILGN